MRGFCVSGVWLGSARVSEAFHNYYDVFQSFFSLTALPQRQPGAQVGRAGGGFGSAIVLGLQFDKGSVSDGNELSQ